MRIHSTDVVYRFRDVATKVDADDNRDIVVHVDLVNHFFGEPFFRTTSLSLAVPMTRTRHKADRDFSSTNVENAYNVHAYVLAAGRIIETNQPGFDYSHNGLTVSARVGNTRNTKSALSRTVS